MTPRSRKIPALESASSTFPVWASPAAGRPRGTCERDGGAACRAASGPPSPFWPARPLPAPPLYPARGSARRCGQPAAGPSTSISVRSAHEVLGYPRVPRPRPPGGERAGPRRSSAPSGQSPKGERLQSFATCPSLVLGKSLAILRALRRRAHGGASRSSGQRGDYDG